jgi:hypothetical protein
LVCLTGSAACRASTSRGPSSTTFRPWRIEAADDSRGCSRSGQCDSGSAAAGLGYGRTGAAFRGHRYHTGSAGHHAKLDRALVAARPSRWWPTSCGCAPGQTTNDELRWLF